MMDRDIFGSPDQTKKRLHTMSFMPTGKGSPYSQTQAQVIGIGINIEPADLVESAARYRIVTSLSYIILARYRNTVEATIS